MMQSIFICNKSLKRINTCLILLVKKMLSSECNHLKFLIMSSILDAHGYNNFAHAINIHS